ncbi:uncharacterized protein LOC119595649 [Penaeus monodon]|uniref:uncharacterized protein LOC119595649 n=1 Tax=Penaeus monodon TaxID=6687 RepID=UPI0018A6E96E|nr:uncharacterized protein LOC119595649 [Penaeus monodon]
MASASSTSSPMDVDFPSLAEMSGIPKDALEISMDFRRAVTSTPVVPGTPLCALTLQEAGLTSSTLECMSISFSEDSAMSEETASFVASSPPGGAPRGTPCPPRVDSAAANSASDGTPVWSGGRCQIPCLEDGNRGKPRRRGRFIHFVHHPFVMRKLFGTSLADRCAGDL